MQGLRQRTPAHALERARKRLRRKVVTHPPRPKPVGGFRQYSRWGLAQHHGVLGAGLQGEPCGRGQGGHQGQRQGCLGAAGGKAQLAAVRDP